MPAFGYNRRPFFGESACAPGGAYRLAPGDVGRSPMQEINPINNLIKDLSERTDVLRGYL